MESWPAVHVDFWWAKVKADGCLSWDEMATAIQTAALLHSADFTAFLPYQQAGAAPQVMTEKEFRMHMDALAVRRRK